MRTKYNKIFVIGLNKTATLTIDYVFKSNYYRTIHWQTHLNSNYTGNLTEESVMRNFENNKKLLDDYLDKNFDVFSDIENLSLNFKILDKQYPNSLFIFNYRSLNSWLLSRLNFGNGEYINYYKKNYRKTLGYLMYGNNINAETNDNIINIWKNLYINHRKNVEDYFKNRDNIIYYDIENETIKDFIEKLPFEMKQKDIQSKHITKNKTWKIENGKFVKIKE